MLLPWAMVDIPRSTQRQRETQAVRRLPTQAINEECPCTGGERDFLHSCGDLDTLGSFSVPRTVPTPSSPSPKAEWDVVERTGIQMEAGFAGNRESPIS